MKNCLLKKVFPAGSRVYYIFWNGRSDEVILGSARSLGYRSALAAAYSGHLLACSSFWLGFETYFGFFYSN
jgi:hypothetical protein